MTWLSEWIDRLMSGAMRALGVPDVPPPERADGMAMDCGAPDAPSEAAPSTNPPAPVPPATDTASPSPPTEANESPSGDRDRSSPPTVNAPVILRVWLRE